MRLEGSLMTNNRNNLIVQPKEFFRDLVSKAMSDSCSQVNHDIEFYLVNLLCDFIEPTKIKTTHGEIDILDTPLATLLQMALESKHEEQKVILKALGDTSLYVSGYFQDYFNKKSFDPNYFIALGSNAYSNLSNLSKQKKREQPFSHLYQTLSENFRNCVEIVAVVSDSCEPPKTSSCLLNLYDRWQKFPSKRLLKKLVDAGILPVASDNKKKN